MRAHNEHGKASEDPQLYCVYH